MDEILEKLTEYTLTLTEALDSCVIANERQLLTGHLVASAQIYALLHRHKHVSVIETLVLTEQRAHGWSYLSGPCGDAVAKKWNAFFAATGITG